MENKRAFVKEKIINNKKYQILHIEDRYDVVLINGNLQSIVSFENRESAEKCLDLLGRKVRIKRAGNQDEFEGIIVYWTDTPPGRIHIIGKTINTDDEETDITFDKFDDKGNELIEKFELLD